MSTIAYMGMRSFLLLLALLPAVWGAEDSLNATNAANNGAPAAAQANALSTPEPAAATLEAARAALANAVTTITNVHAEPVVNPTNGTPLVNQVMRDILDDTRKLRAGDLVRYRVQEDKSPVQRLAVTDGGEIEIEYLGHIKAEGKTCRELAGEVKRLLEENYYYKATVNIAIESVLRKSLGRINIYGAVQMQGPQDIPQDEDWTVSKAVLRAGPTEFANKSKVKLIKGKPGAAADATVSPGKSGKGTKEEPIIVDIAKVFKKGNTEKDPVVEPGDTIIVDTLLIKFN